MCASATLKLGHCCDAEKASPRLAMMSCVLQDGEKVVYSKYAGTELKVSGTEYVILKVRMLCHHWPIQQP